MQITEDLSGAENQDEYDLADGFVVPDDEGDSF